MRKIEVHLPNWFDVFSSVCNRGQEVLEWGHPEPWIQAELYAELKRRAASTGWVPFSTEVPYVTFYPIQLPKQANRDWKVVGAIKWVDLCLHSDAHNAWCWFEIKARHTEDQGRRRNAADLQARDAVRKDVVALIGFNADLTADTWTNPDRYTKAYWFEKTLKPRAASLRSGKHSFAAAFLQLEDELDPVVWNKEALTEQIHKWFSYRSNQVGHHCTCPTIRVMTSSQPLAANHSLVIFEWTSES